MERIHISLDEKVLEKIDAAIKLKNFNSRSDFFTKASEFYIDYMINKTPGEFLNKELAAVLTGSVELTEKRLGNRFAKILSDMAIQIGMLEQIMQAASDLNEDEISNMRKRAIDAIKSNQSVLKYDELAK